MSMNNLLLEKIAEVVEKKKKNHERTSNLVNASIGAAGVASIKGSSDELLGYHNVYHGTTDTSAASIKKTGLDPKFGGGDTGASAAAGGSAAESFKRGSAGKIHVTKDRLTAHMFAGFRAGDSLNHVDSLKAAMRSAIGRDGSVLKVKLSDAQWASFKSDPAFYLAPKDLAATTTHKIPSHQIHGGKGFKGIRGVVNSNTLRRYYSNKGNHGRIAGGAVKAIVGSALAALAAKRVKDNIDHK